ncbi:MAG: D-alanyl-D-alanine carboxypeptidase [Candidatus Melainabacteria bacterium]|nr:MAG: D-alanyl-D-alanine carboxypeptidase [Candidatus Melainabacteria bacterium]
MKKIITLILILFVNSGISFASINKFINSNQLFNTSTVAVSVKKVENENTLYKINDTKLLHPASTLKLLTMASIIDVLKDNYEFKTQILVDKDNNWYIKLSGDPAFSTDDLNGLIRQVKKTSAKKPNKIYIDTSNALDDKTSQPGWMQDDNTSFLYSIYKFIQH